MQPVMPDPSKLDYSTPAGSANPAPPPRPKRGGVSGRLLVLVLVVAGCIAVLALRRAGQPNVGRNVSRVQSPIGDLPASATNISYSLHGLFGPADYYEFDVPEADFLKWAKSNGWTMKPISTPQHFYRYTCDIAEPRDSSEIEISHGYAFELVYPDADDDRLHVGYDDSIGRAFYERSYR